MMAVVKTEVNSPARWERQTNEPGRAYAAFRVLRDTAPSQRRLEAVAAEAHVSSRSVRYWASKWDWWDRVEAWDDECYRVDDQERLDAIRTMHANHRRAGRALLMKALASFNGVEATEIPLPVAARLLDLGARLERSTLIVSVRELQGAEAEVEDSWDRLAAELSQPS
jgi:hypothetical protein